MADDVIEMRDRIAESATQWALVYPLANWGFWGFAKGEARDQIAAVAEDLAAAWGRDIADRVLAELFTATDPGDDLHRQTVERLGRAWPDLTEDPVYLDQLAHEALSVRWGHAVRQAAEVERLRTELTTAQGQVADYRATLKRTTEQLQQAEAKRDQADNVASARGKIIARQMGEMAEAQTEAEAEERSPDDTTEGPRDLLFNEICELFRNPNREWTLADELIALLARLGLLNSQPVRDAELERLRSALDGAKNHIGDVLRRLEQAEAANERVRRLCELTIAASVRVQAIDQARDTLAVLDTPTTDEMWPPQVGDLWEANDGSRWFATDTSLSIGDPEGPDRILFVNGGRAQMEPDELLTADPRLISRRRPLDTPTPTGETDRG
jgi:hypothetical protein